MHSNSAALVAPAAAVTHRPRVTVVAPDLAILGGQGVQAVALMDRLRADGYPVEFLAVNPRFPRSIGWLRRIPMLRTVVNQALYVPSLRKLAEADVVHAYSAAYWSFLLAPVPAMIAARRLGKRVILNYHSGEAADHLARWGAVVRPMLNLAHEIVVPSTYLQQVFRRHGYRTRVVRNIVDTGAFRFRERKPLRPRWLSIRNLQRHYRVDVVIRAFARFRERHPDATLVVGGYGADEARLKQLASDVGGRGIEFVGRVEPAQVPALYDAADIFVNAAEIDNQPVSILEAFAAGLPVLSTGVGDITTMLRGGNAGVVVPCGNPTAFADAASALLADPARVERLVAHARAELAHYDWQAVRDGWRAAYEGAPL